MRSRYGAAFDRPQLVLGCCAPAVCQAAGLPAGCRMAELPGDIAPPKPGEGRADATGVFDFAPSAAQTLMLEHAEGRKPAGWGRASAADIELIGRLHTLKGDLLRRPALLGARGATRLARRMLDAIERASRSLQQMREVTRLDAAHPAFRQALTIPGCTLPDDATRCSLDTFAQLVRGKLVPGQ